MQRIHGFVRIFYGKHLTTFKTFKTFTLKYEERTLQKAQKIYSLTLHVRIDITIVQSTQHHVISPLVDPAPVLGEGVKLVVGDEVGLQVLLPVANTLQWIHS